MRPDPRAPRPRFSGVLTRWDADRGFGFVEPDDQAGERLFVHARAFAPGSAAPREGLRIGFEVEPGPQGRKRAVRVRTVATTAGTEAALRPGAARREARRVTTGSRPDARALLALPVFVLVYLAAAWWWRLPGWVALAYLAMSALCFGAYALDKQAARTGGWRVSERALLLIGLAGGWPGAVLAQQGLRHKSRKQPFRTWFWCSVAVHGGLFVLLAGPWGRPVLATLAAALAR